MFEPGVFAKYRAVTKIHLGALGQDLTANAVVEFDGFTLRYGGADHNVPALQGAIRAGWLVPVADHVSQYVPKPADIQVRASTSTGAARDIVQMETVFEDERVVVGTPKKAADEDALVSATRAVIASGSTTISGDDDAVEVARIKNPATTVVSDKEDGSEGVPVAGVKLASPKMTINMTDKAALAAAERSLRETPKGLGRKALSERRPKKSDAKALPDTQAAD